jgi:ubiquinone/menaquinone biosynthesis C-methylase UbiE
MIAEPAAIVHPCQCPPRRDRRLPSTIPAAMMLPRETRQPHPMEVVLSESDSSLPRGAIVPPMPISAEDFDQAHGEVAKSDVLWELLSRAHGTDCPTEVRAWGNTTWWTLGRFVAGLRLSPGELLLDLACGRGGVGLWLARALNVNLVGVDWSRAGVRAATERSTEFVPPGRARFEVGDMTATGLEGDSMDGAVCADAVFFAEDRIAVFAEVSRVLKPGGRFLFTADDCDDPDRPAAVPDWAPIIERGGLGVVTREEIPNWAEQVKRMYDLWLENLDALRADLGDELIQELVEEAHTVGPTLPRRTGMLYTTEKRGL